MARMETDRGKYAGGCRVTAEGMWRGSVHVMHFPWPQYSLYITDILYSVILNLPKHALILSHYMFNVKLCVHG